MIHTASRDTVDFAALPPYRFHADVTYAARGLRSEFYLYLSEVAVRWPEYVGRALRLDIGACMTIFTDTLTCYLRRVDALADVNGERT